MPCLSEAHASTAIPLLEADLRDLSRRLNVAQGDSHKAVQHSRAHRAAYLGAVKKLDRVDRAMSEAQEDIFYAILASSPLRQLRAESRLATTQADFRAAYEVLSTRLKLLAAAMRTEMALGERVHELRGVVARKREELHRLKPCGRVFCGFCRRERAAGDGAGKVGGRKQQEVEGENRGEEEEREEKKKRVKCLMGRVVGLFRRVKV